MDGVLAELFAPRAARPVEDVPHWRRTADELASRAPFEAAVLGGLQADRVAWAFAHGYASALRALLGSRPPALRALCVTESGGGHPKAIAARVQEGRLTGEKTYVTFGVHAEELLVLAREDGGTDDRPRLGLFAIEADRAGVEVDSGEGRMPFVPELPHGRARFDGVAVREADRLWGDGFADYVRPFRTVEDIHVQGAVLAFLIARGADLGAEAGWTEEAAALLAGLATAAEADASAPSTHRLLGGLELGLKRVLDGAEAFWAAATEEERARWQRDRTLLTVAARVRHARLEKARGG